MHLDNETTIAAQSRGQTVLRMLAYAVSVFVAFFSIAGWPAVLGGWAAVAACVLLMGQQASTRFRLVTVAIASLCLFMMGWFADTWLGSFAFPARILGATSFGIVIEVVTFGLITCGTVLMLRTLAIRWSAFLFVEAIVILAPFVLLLAGHRELQLGKPRFLSDWASTNGFSVITILSAFGVGLVFLGIATFTKERNGQRLFESIVFSCVIAGLVSLIYFNLPRSSQPPHVNGGQGQTSAKLGKADKENDGKESNGKENNGTSGQSKQDGGQKGRGNQNESAGSASKSNKGGEQQQQTSQGFAESKGFDDETDIPPPTSENQQPQNVAIVLLETDFRPPNGVWHFRQSVRSRFEGHRLVAPLAAQANLGVPTAFPTDRLEIPTNPIEESWSQVVSGTVHLMCQQNRPLAPVSTFELGSVQNPNPRLFKRSYSFQSNVLSNPIIEEEECALYTQLTVRETGNPAWSEEHLQSYLTYPSDDSRYKELAEKIIEENLDVAKLADFVKDSAMLRVLTVKRWLEANTVYTHHPETSSSDDPTAEFLFGSRRGYCTHLSHSNVYLLRALGIPARVSIGYMVPVARSGKSSSITIQASDAHAWTEVFFEGVGWVEIEINSEHIDEDTRLPPPPDAETCRTLAKEARQNPLDPRKDDDKGAEKKRAGGLEIAILRILAIIGLLYVPKIWRRVAPFVCGLRQKYRICYRDVLDRLSEVGISRQFGETREQFARRVADQIPAFGSMTRAHLTVRFGKQGSNHEENWMEMRNTVISQIARVTNTSRRCIGVANPVSWLWTS